MSGYSDREDYYQARRRSRSPRDSVSEVYIERRARDRTPSPPPPPRRRFSSTVEEYYGGQRRNASVSSRSSRRDSAISPRTGQLIRYESQSEAITSQPKRPSIISCAESARRASSSSSSTCRTSEAEWEDEYDSETEAEKRRRLRNKTLLYAGLAGVSTIAASNNIYQSTKAHKLRKRQVREGSMCEHELKSRKNKSVALDVFSVGVAAIGVNNAVNGWKKLESLRQEDKAARERMERRDANRMAMVAGY